MANRTITRTKADRQAEAEALHASILKQVQQLTDSGQWRAFLEFARSFHTYSLNNLLLILAQKPEATMVAGFRQWQAKGRQVRKGEKSIKIFGYREKKTETAADDDTPSDGGRLVRYFPTLSVFDIAQTDPIEGADRLPSDPTQQLTGGNDHGVVAPLTHHLQSRGWTIGREPLNHASGYTDPETRRVILAESISVEQSAKTLIHETAHIELHHIDSLEEYRQHRGRMEVEAESVAYVVAGLRGFDTSAYSIGYITGWSYERHHHSRLGLTRPRGSTQHRRDSRPEVTNELKEPRPILSGSGFFHARWRPEGGRKQETTNARSQATSARSESWP